MFKVNGEGRELSVRERALTGKSSTSPGAEPHCNSPMHIISIAQEHHVSAGIYPRMTLGRGACYPWRRCVGLSDAGWLITYVVCDIKLFLRPQGENTLFTPSLTTSEVSV